MNEGKLAYGFTCADEGFTDADELTRAVSGQLLTQEEARTVYWSQFEVLRRNAVDRAVTTPPAIAPQP